jgi:hypothetical protein
MEMYINVARLLIKATSNSSSHGGGHLLRDVKSIVVMTNDHDWAVKEADRLHSEFNVHILPQPPFARQGSSVPNGINNQGEEGKERLAGKEY